MIDESALVDGLKSGALGYACLDVFEHEPYFGPLTQIENTILTAHIGSYATEARISMENKAVDNLFQGLKR